MPKAKVVICEGEDNCALVTAMIDANILPSDIGVTYIGDLLHKKGFGIFALKNFLEASPAPQATRLAKSVAILADNDLSAPHQPLLPHVQRAIRDANSNPSLKKKFAVPTAFYAQATNADISVVLVPMPGGQTAGCFEDLVASVIRHHHPQAMACADALVQCAQSATSSASWSPSKIAKARVAAAIASVHPQNPSLPLKQLWKRAPHIAPLNDSRWGQMIQHLSAL